MRLTNLAVWASALFASHATAQAGPNTLAVYNKQLRTMSENGSPSPNPVLDPPPLTKTAIFIVAIPTTAVAAVVKNYPLLPIPTTDETLFPQGFPADKHRVLVSTNYLNDIRMGDLEIASLMSGSVYVPYVDRLGDGMTPFTYAVSGYIGGTDGEDLMGVVPALVGTIGGTTLYVSEVNPDTAAYAPQGNGQFSSQIKQIIVPNPLSGPGIVPSAVDLLFSNAETPLYTAHTFHTLVNQPLILTTGQCQVNSIYYNETFAGPILQTGTVTLYSGTIPAGLAGVYEGQGGYSANGELVGYTSQACAAAAAAVDPKSLQ